MEVVRKIVDAKKLMSVIPLPETMRNRRVEVIVLPLSLHIIFLSYYYLQYSILTKNIL